MSDENLSPTLRSPLRRMQLLHASLLMGCAIFAVIAIALRAQQDGPVPDQPVKGYLGLAMSGIAVAALLIVPRVIEAHWRRQILRGEVPPSRGHDDLRQ